MANRNVQSGGEQLSLAGFVETALKDRLFFGIFPDEPAQIRIADMAQWILREYGLHGQAFHRSRFHLTLHHLGDYSELQPERIDAALTAIGRITTPSWDIALDHVASFRGRRRHPLVLGCPDVHTGVQAIWHESRAQFAAAGFAQYLQHAFTPHLTLLYADRMFSMPITIEPITWAVREVVLVHSLLGKTEYRLLGRKQLPAG